MIRLGCMAPSEVPGISSQEASLFGGVAEDIIFADFCSQHTCITPQVFNDDNNPSGYLLFLTLNNPHFTQARQIDFYNRLLSERLFRIPDIVVHNPTEQVFYEIKPNSASGRRDGAEKVSVLMAVYPTFGLPYRPGWSFVPRDHRIAFFRSSVAIKMVVERCAPGLIVYKLCLEANSHAIELATIVLLFTIAIRQANRQRRSGQFRPVDLEDALARNHQLEQVARTLGITMVIAAVGAVGWRHFWQAVIRRFAVRGATAALLAAADAFLPIGDLIAAGMAIWTVIDIIRISDQLWLDAAEIARNEA